MIMYALNKSFNGVLDSHYDCIVFPKYFVIIRMVFHLIETNN